MTTPRVVVLCGSTRFKRDHEAANAAETLAGHIVLACGIYGHATDDVTEDQKAALDRLHLHKIDLADEVIVVNPTGYIGQSTQAEIAYARQHHKPVRFTHPYGGALS